MKNIKILKTSANKKIKFIKIQKCAASIKKKEQNLTVKKKELRDHISEVKKTADQ